MGGEERNIGGGHEPAELTHHRLDQLGIKTERGLQRNTGGGGGSRIRMG